MSEMTEEEQQQQLTANLIRGQDTEFLSLDDAVQEVYTLYEEGHISDEDARATLGLPSW